MNGPIAALMAVMMSVAAVLGSADCSSIIEEANAQIEAESRKEEASRFLIAIDPGHQGQGNFEQEPIGPGASETKNKVAGGTTGVSTGVREFELTLDIGLQLRDALLEKGYEVLMIRETHDVNISNAVRAQMANEANADVFVRLHANGSESSSATGVITMCQTASNPYNGDLYSKSRELSEKILEAYVEETGLANRGIQETNTMSGINWCNVPVTILEMGFMTNPHEDELMQDEDFQKKMVSGIVKGIEAYLEDKEPARGQTPEGEAAAGDLSGGEETADTGGTAEEAAIASDTGTAAAEEEEAASASNTGIAAAEEEEAASGGTTETEAAEEEPDEKEPEDMDHSPYNGVLSTTTFTPARRLGGAAKELREVVSETARQTKAKYREEQFAEMNARMDDLEVKLEKELGRLGGSWSLYLKHLDSGRVIGIREKEQMIAASLIKLFVAGEFFTETEAGVLDEEKYGNLPDIMINVSDNGAANTLINAVGMDAVNEFAAKNGFPATKLNRRMLEWNGSENYTSTADCGKMLEQVLRGKYVSKRASERILEDLIDQERRGKIPAGVPDDIETGNKTGELDNVDNDAAIIWSPSGTYILCIMSTNGGNRIPEIVTLSRMVYNTLNGIE